ncbi:2-amino-4-hydroxy-6-hydroxymethyldihydropteridine diphosphokinase [Sutterella sp.]|uniref:2-amino-4-hydroxy-6- hydroxymethyldihydropteridine diphosphokinase n=1 Tax=Sutterella sp. TaxID=1981025 RepID=UPI0026DF5C8F|nr:2-amino-4-hydroxy-6-hydroxymethyldihydropteridine diphosphokinase [Sutterella sp.]MDO5531750.1 2-amino-4-hydroxy-6-hydroxymethyldihydropteridine diphosphokinase [Sutterella sp.]
MTREARRAWLSLGANLGDPVAMLREAVRRIQATEGVTLVAESSLWRTSPVDSFGPEYVNAALALETVLKPMELLAAMQAIENDCGRVRPAGVHNAPRTLDIDILAFEGVTIGDPRLTLPHPRMNERLFVLVPLSEIEPGWKSPAGVPVRELIETVREKDPTQRIERI